MWGWPGFPCSGTPGLQGSVPRVQTLELARAPLLGRTDGVCKCTWLSQGFWQTTGGETHRRADERDLEPGCFIWER